MRDPEASVVAAIDGLSRQIHLAVWEFLAHGSDTPITETKFSLPFTRAARQDYARIVQLWKTFHSNRPVTLDLPHRPCPGCGSERHRQRFVSYDLYPFHVCEECGSFFVAHMVEEDFIERFLTAVPEAREISDRMMSSRDRDTLASDHKRFEAYFSLAEQLAADSGKGKRYLDIGCGVGHSIDAASARGYDATGLEISRTALETARSRGRNCHHPEEWAEEGFFDLVTLFETLEHVADPFAMLQRARSRLAKNGLLIITIPNGAGWEVSLLSERCLHAYGGSDGVGHINLFSPAGLSALLKRSGLEPLLFDGQFGNNALLIASGLRDAKQEALGSTGDGEITLRVPEPLQRILQSAEPVLTALERANLRSPILIAIACLKEATPRFGPRAESLDAERRAAILASLPRPNSARPEDKPLFDATTRQPVGRIIDRTLQTTLSRSGINPAVRGGVSVRSFSPLKFDTMIRLGRGKLKPGDYEVAIAALIRAGAAALGVLDEEKGEWISIKNIDPAEYWMRQPFRIERKTRISLLITANNIDPTDVDLELFDVGVARVAT